MCEASHSATVSGVPETVISPPPLPPSAEIDNPVGSFNHIEVVLNHHDGIALIAQLVQHFQQLLDIGEVQTGGRLIEDIQRLAGTALDNSRASFTRCASPPDRVVADWPRRI